MCGRLTLTAPDLSAVAEEVEARLDPADARRYRPRYNAAPSDLHFVVREEAGQRRIQPAVWGLRGSNGQLLINARGETAATRPRFRDAVARRRCVVPADGFYEWTGGPGDRRPLWFHLRERGNAGLFFLAGLLDDEGGLAGASPRFAVLTTAANGLVSPAHDRMPVILDRGSARRWLETADLSLLSPAPEALLVATEVSPRVNAVANDDAACIEALDRFAPGARRAQLSLL
ncbi:MAG: SOS response-associated peptidase [Myxococcales bacterium]